jgi:hypothetical protein
MADLQMTGGQNASMMEAETEAETVAAPEESMNAKKNMNMNSQAGGGKKMTVGSKRQVWNGTAKHTAGGLTRKDLMKHKGRIVSRKKHAAGRKALANLKKAGYVAKKGTFKLFKKGKK